MHSSRTLTAALPGRYRLMAGLVLALATLAPELHAAAVVKQLYMGAGTTLSRTRSTSTTATTLAKGGGAATWTLNPSLAGALTLAAGTIDIYLQLTCTSGKKTRSFDLSLDSSLGNIGSVTGQSYTFGTCGTYETLGPYSVTLGSPLNLSAGQTLSLTVTNTTAGGGTRSLGVRPSDGVTSLSRVEYDVDTTTIINVDSVLVYTAAYNGGSADTGIDAGATGYIRAVVSDPFGDYDIEPTTNTVPLTITGPNPAATVVLGPVDMTDVGADGSAATRTFEYAYTVAELVTPGTYTLSVTADEGVEGTVSHTRNNATVAFRTPSISLTRLSVTYSDPVNATTDPKRIPGSIITHTLTGQNDGTGMGGTIVLLEQLSTTSQFDVGFGVAFDAGTSGLLAPTVTYSTQPCASFVADLTPTGPFDASVRCIRIALGGSIARNTGTPPSFTVTYRARVP